MKLYMLEPDENGGLSWFSVFVAADIVETRQRASIQLVKPRLMKGAESDSEVISPHNIPSRPCRSMLMYFQTKFALRIIREKKRLNPERVPFRLASAHRNLRPQRIRRGRSPSAPPQQACEIEDVLKQVNARYRGCPTLFLPFSPF